ncbi:MAG: hypothetical protein IK091_04435, partial [Spirochaetales bacterium]|nr:hypothetical protein [Spirochaetales bacterium]
PVKAQGLKSSALQASSGQRQGCLRSLQILPDGPHGILRGEVARKICLAPETRVPEKFAEAQRKKIHSVDIRVAKKNDELILRLKDDCVKFDPAARKDMLDPEDPAKNIGIRMVYGMTDKIEYHNILGLNVITIRI